MPLSPSLGEERERAGEDAGHDQRAPDGPALRHRHTVDDERNGEQADEGGDHLDERERERVEPRREPLHQDDLERVDGSSTEHEEVADGRAAAHTREESEARRRERDRTQVLAPIRVPKSSSARRGVITTYIPVTKPVDETDVRSRPAVCSAYPAPSSAPAIAPAARPLRPSARTRWNAGPASVKLAIAKRMARNANSG